MKKERLKPECAACEHHRCSEGADCFGVLSRHAELYRDDRLSRFHRAATAIEGRHYCRQTRLGEIILFAREMNFRKLGVAFCVGLAEEVEVICQILSEEFDVYSVCCKVAGITKDRFGLEQIDPEKEREVMCNPAGQADLLNRAGTGLNIIAGLCVGHDAIFSARSEAPVTTLIAKDRVLAHNPAGAVYCPYIRKQLPPEV